MELRPKIKMVPGPTFSRVALMIIHSAIFGPATRAYCVYIDKKALAERGCNETFKGVVYPKLKAECRKNAIVTVLQNNTYGRESIRSYLHMTGCIFMTGLH